MTGDAAGSRRASLDVAARSASWPVAALGALALVGFGGYIRYTTADALLFALMSTRRLTVVYWGQDRLVNLLPALASPIRHEATNFYAQMTVMAISFFGLVMLLCRLHAAHIGRRPAPHVLAAATLIAGTISMLLMRGRVGYWFIFEQFYAAALLLFVVGLIAIATARPRAVAAGVALIVAAALVNPSIVLSAPFAWFFAAPERRTRYLATVGAASASAYVVTTVASAIYRSGPSFRAAYSDFAVGRALDGLEPTVSNLLGSVRLLPTLVVMVASVVALVVAGRRRAGVAMWPHVAATAFGVLWVLAFSGNRWIEMSGFAARYFFPLYAAGLFLLCSAATEAVLIADDHAHYHGAARLGHVIVAVATVAVALSGVVRLSASSGIPALDQGRQDAAVARDEQVRVVVGDYWRVWPMVVASESDGRRLFPITFRSQVIDDQTEQYLASLPSDAELEVLCVDVDQEFCLAELERQSHVTWAPVEYVDGDLSVLTVTR